MKNSLKVLNLKQFVAFAKSGTVNDIDNIMNWLTEDCSFAVTRFVDYALSEVTNQEGIDRIKYYLMSGTLIQRNYASLFFSRRNILEEWAFIKEAYIAINRSAFPGMLQQQSEH